VPSTTEPVQPATEPAAEPAAVQELRNSINSSLQEATSRPEAVHQSGIGLGITSGFFGSFAEGATLRDDIREYYFSLMRRINEAWWTHGTMNTVTRGASFIIVVSRDGRVLACNLMQSTGNRLHDQMLLETVKLAEPLPPLPDSFRDVVFNAPIRFIPPLGMMLNSGKPTLLSPH
jgi:TonB family protein